MLWTFIVLPRFKKLANRASNFQGDPLKAWLHLLTRSENEVVEVTHGLVAGDDAVTDADNCLSHLTPEEVQTAKKFQN